MDEELYQEQILDHYRHPRHKKVMEGATCKAQGNNPMCGDELTVFIDIVGDTKSGKGNKSGRVNQLTFTGHGCAISQAAASLVIESLQGKTIEVIKKLQDKEVLGLLGIPITATRMKCALLIYKTLQQGVKEYKRQHYEEQNGNGLKGTKRIKSAKHSMTTK